MHPSLKTPWPKVYTDTRVDELWHIARPVRIVMHDARSAGPRATRPRDAGPRLLAQSLQLRKNAAARALCLFPLSLMCRAARRVPAATEGSICSVHVYTFAVSRDPFLRSSLFRQ